MGKKAVMVCGHGSRDPEALREFELVGAGIRARLPDHDIETGYLEFARPMIREGFETLRARGAKRILALPGMLFAASHVKNDLPWEANSFMQANPGVEVKLGRDLAIDGKLLEAAADRIGAAELAAGGAVARGDTLLLVIGRGTSDPDANSNVAKLSRMLWEGMGFGWAEIGFSGTAHPRVGPAIERAARLGFGRIVVFPYFLFTGVLVKRIYAETDAMAAQHPAIEIVKAGYLRDHPLVLDAFAERVVEIDGGTPTMNCQLCKYRTQIVGYGDSVGAVQAGHHHHVAGIGTDADGHRHDGVHHHHHHHHGETE
jgi:sirohydrochlorin cobaltochelatase